MSIGFYIYDLLHIVSCVYRAKANEEFKRQLPYIIHHIAGVYLLHEALTYESKEHVLNGYNILETSNVMIYISYHLHKEYATYLHLTMSSEFIQLIWYSYYRIIQFSSFIYNNQSRVFQFYFTTQFLIFVLYSMGVIWSYKLLNKNIKNFNALKERHYGYKD